MCCSTAAEVWSLPKKGYRLFQVADMRCTLEMMQVKLDVNQLSRSELFFFRGKRSLKKDYLDKWRRQRLNPR